MEFACGNCGATLEVAAHQLTTVCPYCAVAAVVESAPQPNVPRPSFVVPFLLPEARVRADLQRWLRSRWFVRSAAKRATISSLRGIYVPAYLYSAVARSTYQAEIGEDYTETETYTTTDSKGNTVTRTRTVVKTEWRTLSGEHASYILDVLVTASRGIPNDALEAVEPFDLKALRRYTPALVSGWIAEQSTIAAEQCRTLARQEADALLSHRLETFMPGDKHSNLRFDRRFDRETLDLMLVPLWVIAAKWHPKKPVLHLLVNGQTGKISGSLPRSWLKITFLTVLVLALIVAAFGIRYLALGGH